VQGVVFLPMWTGIVVMIGRYMLGVRSKMYDAAIKEQLDYDDEIAKFAATAVVAAQIFNSANNDDTEKRGLSVVDLQDVFKGAPGVSDHMAHLLAEEIVKSADGKKQQDDGKQKQDAGDNNGFVTLPELTDVLTTNICSWQRMSLELHVAEQEEKANKGNKGNNKVAVAPQPQQQNQATQQAPTQDGAVVKVVCPPGVLPGQMMQVATPDGRSIQCAVPVGVQPGQQFTIQVPPQQQAPAGSVLTVTCPQGAVPGQAIQVQGPGGLISVTVPPGVQTGQQFQVRV